jgi:hypothetical protein
MTWPVAWPRWRRSQDRGCSSQQQERGNSPIGQKRGWRGSGALILRAIKQVLTEHISLMRDIWKDPKSGPAEKRQLIDQLYYLMIEIGRYGKKAMKDIDGALHD